jgi:GTP-binding protein HflX
MRFAISSPRGGNRITTKLYGNIKGLRSSEQKALQRLYGRRLDPSRLVTGDLARELAQIATETSRQVGVLLSRRGAVEYVIVGTPQALELPEIGRFRAGAGRLRGLRLIHVHLHDEPLATDDLTDLSLLALDAVAVIRWTPGTLEPMVSWAHLLPENPEGRHWEIHADLPAHRIDADFPAFIREIEGEIGRKASVLDADSSGERAFLVHLARPGDPFQEAWDVAELRELAATAGLDVVDVVIQRRRPDNKTFIGRGRLTALIIEAMQRHVDLLVMSPALTPAQIRAISDIAEIRVIDRTQLILDIFAQRARSADGKVQVELAQLRHLLPRLAGSGKAMSRLMGGIGGRGPGETQLEVDRRRINRRISHLERALKQLSRERANRRRRRTRAGIPVISIVGYTNAGKSTLLNTLTHAEAVAENKLFATLDPFSKRMRFPTDREVILTDTVGFIRDLPKTLVQAFQATLEELEQADLFIHVVDASSPHRDEQKESIERILHDMELGRTPRIVFYNKIDLVEDPKEEAALRRQDAYVGSARTRATLRPLMEHIEALIARGSFTDLRQGQGSDD